MADGAARFRQDSSGPALLRIPLPSPSLRVRGFHPLRPAFPDSSTSDVLRLSRSYNPGPALTAPVWAPSRSLAATWEIILIFFSSGYLDVSVPRVCPHFVGGASRNAPGCPIRTSADQRLFAPPRGFSQLVTSFFASKSQGIPCTPFVTYSLVLLVFLLPSCRIYIPHGLDFLSLSLFQHVNELSSRNLAPRPGRLLWRITDSNR